MIFSAAKSLSSEVRFQAFPRIPRPLKAGRFFHPNRVKKGFTSKRCSAMEKGVASRRFLHQWHTDWTKGVFYGEKQPGEIHHQEKNDR